MLDRISPQAFIPLCLMTARLLVWLACLCAVAKAQSDRQFAPKPITSREKFQSISVLGDMPADQMGKVMNMMSASLGVNCGFCHEGTNFAKDHVGQKEEGRRMLSMTLELNQRFFHGKPEVNCNTCHRGKSRPDAPISLEQLPSSLSHSEPLAKPSTEEVWNRYLNALGGKEQVAALKTRHVIARRIEPDGRSESEDLWQNSNGQSIMTTQYGAISVTECYDGEEAWKHANRSFIELKPDEAEQIRIEAFLAFGLSAMSSYPALMFQRTERILDREVLVMETNAKNAIPLLLFFDKQSGLLVRRVASVPTILGPFEYRVDYHDYQEFGGVMQPTKIRFAVPNITWTRQVQNIETNINLDKSLFRRP